MNSSSPASTNGSVSKSNQRLTPVRIAGSYGLLDSNNVELGTVRVTDHKNAWFFASFDESPRFQEVRSLFDEHRELVNQQAFPLAEEAEEKIASLGLHLRALTGEAIEPIRNV